MSRLLKTKPMTVEKGESLISFEHEEPGAFWFKRYLLVEGKRAFHIGFSCGTCVFLFERLGDFVPHKSPSELVRQFSAGVEELDDTTVREAAHLLPRGEYIASLLELVPVRVDPGSHRDYFTNEAPAAWEGDPGELQHSPKVEYYRTASLEIRPRQWLQEFIVPMFSLADVANCLATTKSWETVVSYAASLEGGRRPTALAVGILDIKEPDFSRPDPGFDAHWCLAHYLLDGHHKICAAAMLGRPITLLSFLSVAESRVTREALGELTNTLRRS